MCVCVCVCGMPVIEKGLSMLVYEDGRIEIVFCSIRAGLHFRVAKQDTNAVCLCQTSNGLEEEREIKRVLASVRFC